MESALALGQSPSVADIEGQNEGGLKASVLPHESRKPAAERGSDKKCPDSASSAPGCSRHRSWLPILPEVVGTLVLKVNNPFDLRLPERLNRTADVLPI